MMGRVLSAIAVTPSVAVATPAALALSAGCDLVQWCAGRVANTADVVAELATETAEAARFVAAIGRDA